MVLSACGAAGLLPDWRLFEHTILPAARPRFLVAEVLRPRAESGGAALRWLPC